METTHVGMASSWSQYEPPAARTSTSITSFN